MNCRRLSTSPIIRRRVLPDDPHPVPVLYRITWKLSVISDLRILRLKRGQVLWIVLKTCFRYKLPERLECEIIDLRVWGSYRDNESLRRDESEEKGNKRWVYPGLPGLPLEKDVPPLIRWKQQTQGCSKYET